MNKKTLDEGVPGSVTPKTTDHVEGSFFHFPLALLFFNVFDCLVYYSVKFFVGAEEKHVFSSSLVHDLPLRFVVGDGKVLKAINEAVCQMVMGEKAAFTFSPSSPFFSELIWSYDLAKDEELPTGGSCVVELVLVKHLPNKNAGGQLLSRNSWEIPEHERVNAATQLKDIGNKSLVAKSYEEAITFYEKGYSLVSGMLSTSARQIALILLLNKAQALLSSKKPSEAIKVCDLVINKSYFTPKAWYRKACGLVDMENLEEAKEILKEAIEIFDGKEFKEKLEEAVSIEKRLENKEKRFYANMLK